MFHLIYHLFIFSQTSAENARKARIELNRTQAELGALRTDFDRVTTEFDTSRAKEEKVIGDFEVNIIVLNFLMRRCGG